MCRERRAAAAAKSSADEKGEGLTDMFQKPTSECLYAEAESCVPAFLMRATRLDRTRRAGEVVKGGKTTIVVSRGILIFMKPEQHTNVFTVGFFNCFHERECIRRKYSRETTLHGRGSSVKIRAPQMEKMER
jgi:hypothetical protein